MNDLLVAIYRISRFFRGKFIIRDEGTIDSQQVFATIGPFVGFKTLHEREREAGHHLDPNTNITKFLPSDRI